MRNIITSLAYLLFTLCIFAQEECTIGVACGTATEDGRPLLWKTRDYLSEPANKIQYITEYDYNFIAVTNDGNSNLAWMGVNEHGMAIVNSSSKDLPDGSSTGPGNGTFMTMVLGTCKTVSEMQILLDNTNISGRRTNANYAVIDSTGAAAIFETANTAYWRYDAANENNGYVLRTNFAINGGGSGGYERYERTSKLVNDFHNGDTLNLKSILRYQMRDFSDSQSRIITVPYDGSWSGVEHGYIPTNLSICRNSSVSSAVIHGTHSNEPAGLTTMWAILGHPASSIALPYWPVDLPPPESTGTFTSELDEVANQIKDLLFDLPADNIYIDTYKLLNGEGEGLWTRTLTREDSIINTITNLIDKWRELNYLPVNDMKYTADTTAQSTYSFLLSCYNYLISDPSSAELIIPDKQLHAAILPNPAINRAVLQYKITKPSKVQIEILSAEGRIIDKRIYPDILPGTYNHDLLSGKSSLPGGIYFVRIIANEHSRVLRLIKY